MKVHNTLGNGFQEVIYQRCLALEMHKAGLTFGREIEQIIYYEGVDVGTRRADFIVEGKIMVELKALINLEDVHLAQAKNYVVAYDFPVGLLINFGATSLQFKKVFNAKYNRLNQDLQNEKNKQDILINNQSISSSNPVNPDSDNLQLTKS